MIRLVISVLFLLLFGCSTSVTHTFPAVDRDQLWTAMVATAGAPEYNSADIHSRWIVVDNEVKTNSERGMIEVRRTLSRIVQRPREQAQKDRRTTQFSVQLLPVEPPTVEFVSQGYSFTPVRDAHEAEHYFSALDDMLIPIHNESPN